MEQKNKDVDRLWDEYLKTRSKTAKDKLLVEYSSLVKYTAQRMAINLPKSVDVNDLMGAGVVGLIKAVEAFDMAHEVKFETFATHKVRGAILDELRSLDWVPRSVRQKARSLQRVYAKLENDLGRMPYDDEVMAEMKIGQKEFEDMLSEVTPTTIISLEEAMPEKPGGDSKQITLIDVIADPNGTNPLKEMGFAETKRILKETIAALPEKERLVIALYHYEELTLKEIGEVLNISESRVSQIHSKAIIKLRSRLIKRMNE
ncbi:MAG: hypothetical protein A2268_03980 [Candidatus Raymondbacteria bacterium RifOxyA12_full_50_37]|uniref:RNA polymerase sigma-70 domain-containing protein n=1 Tax=Candidatus Raymondbacteria bacterium RIFOXYD12_FULL_49_13 TaxID=1817890 RepID=A0A1F7FAQ6_UNCRA|nr:MAG: hypothetical protein A2268_03980 [Candidatus Raymondbacteria bacterium RifOxyA12_full_50_37]OGJ92616.1 MAG: hypothetical protein A2248_05970 [Candidatus Raymondbacteria bacterium RIFOXYA2_FULL_49_16]OGJ97970.1 MAG: hypothetical protein A2453_02995 [Candidatus Raymondbacteria bacterium RIFOXYC2_FULL_50_21]OGJ98624.1 MAG: hypothetical protein A2487_05610 [Candidatus Raymondbacteria bacterium RifOxyC12_full_50_8]OGK01983.1 MAG: hypothetical protein A2350_21085 [Candidatus Raymondbacteria b